MILEKYGFKLGVMNHYFKLNYNFKISLKSLRTTIINQLKIKNIFIKKKYLIIL